VKILVTGGAGFIGSHLVETLVARGHSITVFDDLSTGKYEYLKGCEGQFTFVNGDIRNETAIDSVVRGHDFVFHLCDNSDIQFSVQHPKTYIDQNIVGCFHLLTSMKKHGVRKIAFPSSTSVFGDATTVPTPESYGPLQPMNLYGAAKLSCEALISAYAYSFDMQAWIFRFVNVIGPRLDHGAIFDFIRKLRTNPAELHILGDGTQQRSYLIINDCLDGILTATERCSNVVNTVHLGNRQQLSIADVAKLVCEQMGLSSVRFTFSGGKKGWMGDANTNFISTETLDKLNWSPKLNSAEAVREAARRILAMGSDS
jgi:UDP-glucose 4-epimerase